MMVWFLVILILLLCLFLLAIRPNSGRQERMKSFEEVYIAHRGLFDNETVPENSLKAFAGAVNAGYGIELDVQLTSDDQLVVFHDETLKRMCDDGRKLHELPLKELLKLRLLGTEETIPLLRDVLDTVGGKVPLIVEIKSEGRYLETTRHTDELLRSYQGLYVVESFHPMVLRWLRLHHPETIRGQLSTDYRRDNAKVPRWQGFLLTNLMLNFLSRPDFIAYNRAYMRRGAFRLCRWLYRPTCAAWTVKSQAQLEEARSCYSVFIFDSFLPDSVTDERAGGTRHEEKK